MPCANFLSAGAGYEPEIAAALRVADKAFSIGLVPLSGVAIGWETERQLRAELVALIGEVAALLGEGCPAAVLDHAVHEPLHAIAENLSFFRETAACLRAAQAARVFVEGLLT
ncbi:hypothetical protein [Cupriavidus sp. D39]|uniref:hypothetical protein n=1 Tax=Cupriavidus sp. D39 TaxID=2997877 RepID=UPI00226E2A97|nr:hypothetical protein [Cupriavidus sp. D39]MCY0856882.1 hypothetical protein [Cupriavidus sp. D39]